MVRLIFCRAPHATAHTYTIEHAHACLIHYIHKQPLQAQGTSVTFAEIIFGIVQIRLDENQ